MSIATGYNFDYGPVDVLDPEDRVYPQDFLEVVEDGESGTQMAGKSTVSASLTIITHVPAADGVDTDVQAEKAFEDHKRLMDALWPSLNAAGLLLPPEIVSGAWAPRLVRAVPAELKTVFRLVYRHSRANPAST